jgi:hypothetical protein
MPVRRSRTARRDCALGDDAFRHLQRPRRASWIQIAANEAQPPGETGGKRGGDGRTPADAPCWASDALEHDRCGVGKKLTASKAGVGANLQ